MLQKFMLILLFSLFLLQGCQGAADPNSQGLDHKAGGSNEGVRENHHVSIYRDKSKENIEGLIFYPVEPNNNPYGFQEYSAGDAEVIQAGYGQEVYVDRQILAKSVAQILVGLEGIEKASVLVTDEECIIGYQAKSNGHVSIQDQVEKSGLAVTPRWYKVYATNDQQKIEQIRQFMEVDGQVSQPELHERVQQLLTQLSDAEEHQLSKQRNMKSSR